MRHKKLLITQVESLHAVSYLDCEQSLFFFRFSKRNARVRERWTAKSRDARNEGAPFPSCAFSHARGHLRVSGVLLDRTKKKERLLVVYFLLQHKNISCFELHPRLWNHSEQTVCSLWLGYKFEEGYTHEKSNCPVSNTFMPLLAPSTMSLPSVQWLKKIRLWMDR